MQPITVTVGSFPTADTDAIVAPETLLAAGDLTLTTDPFVLNPPRHVTVTSVGDDSGLTFTIYGTTYNGTPIVETVTGPNAATATTTMDFATVSRIAVSGATADDVEAGFAQSGASRWVRTDSFANAQTVLHVKVDGTVSYSVETSMDDPDSPTHPVAVTAMTWLNCADSAVVSKTVNAQGSLSVTPTFLRIKQASGSGSCTMTLAQFSNAPF